MIDLRRYQRVAKSYWQLNKFAAKAGVQTIADRLRGDKLAESWSLPFETTLRMMALGSPHDEVNDVALIRDPVDHLSRLPQPLRAKRTSVMAGLVPGEWVEAAESSRARIILFLHGGGYVFGSPNTHRLITSTVARSAAARVLAIDYRLAPEYPYPAALEDAWAAYWWLLAQGIDAKQIVLMGDSAGGGLSLALMLALREAGLPLPAGAALLSPWLDLALESESIRKNQRTDFLTLAGLQTASHMYALDHDPHDPLISPLFADLHGLPPLLIHTGTAEVLLDDSRRVVARAKEAGVEVEYVEWKDMVHVFQFWYLLEPKARQSIQQIGEFVKKRTATASVQRMEVTIRKATG